MPCVGDDVVVSTDQDVLCVGDDVVVSTDQGVLCVGDDAVVSTDQDVPCAPQGQWVLLHNAHNCPHLLNAVESLLAESVPVNSQSDQTFRLWITSKAVPEVLPVRLIQNSVKTVIDSPKVSLCTAFGRDASW